MDIVPNDIPERDVVEEVNYRTSRAGLTTRSGGPIPLKTMSTSSTEKFRRNYDRIYGKK